MEFIFELLNDYGFLLIFLILPLLSVFGNAIGKLAQKAAEKAEQQKRMLSGEAPPPPKRSEVTQRPVIEEAQAKTAPEQPPSRDALAREIRKMMGLEEQPTATEAPRRATERAERRRPPRAEPMPKPAPEPEPERAAPRRGRLAEDMALRDQAQKARDRVGARDAHLGERISGRHEVGEREIGTLAARFAQATAKKRRKRRRALQISHPASAIVSMEVFGQPRGLREWD